jgi:hypothetical protein
MLLSAMTDDEAQTFTCDDCGRTFASGDAPRQVLDPPRFEYRDRRRDSSASAGHVCDDCYREFMRKIGAAPRRVD